MARPYGLPGKNQDGSYTDPSLCRNPVALGNAGAHRAWASAFWLWLPAGPDRNFIWRAPTIARTMSASQCSAIFVPDGSRSVTASCMRHRRRHRRQPEPEWVARASSGADIEYSVKNIAPPKCMSHSLGVSWSRRRLAGGAGQRYRLPNSVTRGSREPRPSLANDGEKGSHGDRKRRGTIYDRGVRHPQNH